MTSSVPDNNFIAASQSQFACLFGTEVVKYTHLLAATGRFTHHALEQLIEIYPPAHLGIRAMIEEVPDTHRLEGVLGNASSLEAIAAIDRGMMWVNVRRVMEWSLQYRRVLDSVFNERERLVSGLRMCKRSIGVLISSPGARVPYHANMQGSTSVR